VELNQMVNGWKTSNRSRRIGSQAWRGRGERARTGTRTRTGGGGGGGSSIEEGV